MACPCLSAHFVVVVACTLCWCQFAPCTATPSRAQLFYEIARDGLNPYDPFLRILDRYPEDQMIIAKTAHLTACAITAACKRVLVPEASGFVAWILQTIQNPTPKTLVPAVSALKILLKNEILHAAFVPDTSDDGKVCLCAHIGVQGTFCARALKHVTHFPPLSLHPSSAHVRQRCGLTDPTK
jgi:hypothetical protein